MDQTEMEFILYHGNQNFTYKEISAMLEKTMDVKMSPNAICKRLKNAGMNCKRGQTIHSRNEVRTVLQEVLPNVHHTVGYRQMTTILRQKGIHVRRDTVMQLMQELDPIGVVYRKRHRINRRVYRSVGPNYVWHIDGYDKLKPYGFPIHGCIDGYSKKIMWLTVGPTNNDPAVVALNYAICINELKGCPMILQADPGTENSVCGALQSMYMKVSSPVFNNFSVVKSKLNQRIEAWWSMFRKQTSDWWINLFKDLELFGGFRRGNEIDLMCLRYCFMPILRNELNSVTERWNNHYISLSRAVACPNGRPNYMYIFTVPELMGGRDSLQSLESVDIEFAFAQCKIPSRSGSEMFDTSARTEFRRMGWSDAEDWHGALKQYFYLQEWSHGLQ